MRNITEIVQNTSLSQGILPLLPEEWSDNREYFMPVTVDTP
jgi:hypothetical protein